MRIKLKAVFEVLTSSLKLGLTSFGGPVAHLGYFHDEYVSRRKWLDEDGFAELTALCQLLPGPASSQFGMAVGTMRAGFAGAIFAWAGFTLPSAAIMTGFALVMKSTGLDPNAGWLHGLKIVAVAIVAQAVVAMGKALAPDRQRATMALASMAVVLLWTTAASQVAVIAVAAVAGLFIFRRNEAVPGAGLRVPTSLRTGVLCLGLFIAILILLPLIRYATGSQWAAFGDAMYRTGALVFGGGHVILPLLEREVVPTGWISSVAFLAGYGAAQAAPGPLFTFTAYLGALMGGVGGAAFALLMIFLPAFLLIQGACPFWSRIQTMPRVLRAVTGVNDAVVGILVAALYRPLWTSAIMRPHDFVLAAALYGMLAFWKLPSWIVVGSGAAMGTALYYFK